VLFYRISRAEGLGFAVDAVTADGGFVCHVAFGYPTEDAAREVLQKEIRAAAANGFPACELRPKPKSE